MRDSRVVPPLIKAVKDPPAGRPHTCRRGARGGGRRRPGETPRWPMPSTIPTTRCGWKRHGPSANWAGCRKATCRGRNT
ncbi:hypothetical protein [Methanoculleus chikugoensis]|uniref:hypothetical protein n=1 Tax=Methanoculleus chikugoensis TaxID=118126 RepID=UPI001FB285E6|nr:hypothetical protein [Methanoculleus chikugoensis]